MENLTSDQLPQAVGMLIEKVSHLEEILTEQSNQANALEKPIPIKEAAKFLNMAVQTLYGKVSRREIPVNKQGKHLLFYISELENWIKSGRLRTKEEIKSRTLKLI